MSNSINEMRNGLEIAVIGMSARFPGAQNYKELWHNLKNGVESLEFYSEEELRKAGVPEEKIGSADFIKVKGGRIRRRDSFDYTFFGYTPYEARVMNPQTRILHEVVWEALEDAGYNPLEYEKLIGLFAGASSSFYWEGINALSERDKESNDFSESQFMDKDYSCSKISYTLNLKGPVFHLHTACSTSLVAVHQACQSLLNGECDMALAGGVSLKAHEEYGYMYQEGMILSPDGHCRPFDKDAAGFVGGEGAGIIVLKVLDDAIRDNDHIYALIKGSAINNDGQRKDSYTSPSVAGQEGVIKYAHQLAGVDPDSISLVETHGTATNLGDQIEIEALKGAFKTSDHSSGQNYCALGAIKANIGHLDTAAGIAGLIKIVLALQYKQIPPMVNFKEYNPRLKLDDSPFYINTETIPWEAKEGPRRAGVSSFGIGGTNAHVIMEEFVPPAKGKNNGTEELILLSAHSQDGLNNSIDNLKNFIASNQDISLADLAHTLQVGRKCFGHRCMFLANDLKMAASVLDHPTSGKIKFAQVPTRRNNVVFMFSGLGSQYVNMGKQLYSRIDYFRKTVDNCYQILQQEIGVDIPHFYHAAESVIGDNIHEFVNSQFVVFILEYAIASLLMHWGANPSGVIGYSLGEYTAACIAGVMTVKETLEILKVRGELIAKIEDSVLLSIPLPKKKAERYLHSDLSLAIDNGESCIFAGRTDVISQLEQQLKRERILSIRIANTRAVHSHLALPVVEEFKKAVDTINWQKSKFPIISNVKGEWISGQEIASVEYWAEHLTQTVLFHQSMKLLSQLDEPVLIEIGPGRDLANLASRYSKNKGIILNTIKSEGEDEDDVVLLLKRIGFLWLNGIDWEWKKIFTSQNRHRISLPTYPFQEQLVKNDMTSKQVFDVLKELGQTKTDKEPVEEVYSIAWKSSIPVIADYQEEKKAESIMVFASLHPVCTSFQRLLAEASNHITRVERNDSFEIRPNSSYTLHPAEFSHYTNLFLDLVEKNEVPDKIIYFWSMDNLCADLETDLLTKFKSTQTTGLYGLVLLARAIKEIGIISDIEIVIITNNLHCVTGEENLFVESATVMGPLKVFPQEMSSLKTRNIDFSLPADGKKHLYERGARQLYQAVQCLSSNRIIAFRGEKGWIEEFDVISNAGKTSLLKPKGVYVITGGIGEIGLQLAEALARDYKANLILMGRSQLSSTQTGGDQESVKISSIQKLRNLGAEVLYLQGDVGNYDQFEESFKVGESRFGKIDGIFHCAGIVDEKSFKMVIESNQSNFENQFQAKVYGLLNLEKLLKNRAPDFCLVMSSVSTVLGGLGFCAYVSANAFMDYKILSKPESPTRWISLDWDKLTPAKTVATIYRILTLKNISRVVVSNVGELKDRIARWIDLHELDEAVPAIMDYRNDVRNRLSTEYFAPQRDTEKQLVKIWQDFFGIAAVGIKDSFFELGGDSLKALSLLNLIRNNLKKEVTLRELMNHSSIEKLAMLIDQKNAGNYAVNVWKPDTEHLDQPFPLTDVQFAYWIGRFDVMELGNIAAHGYQENDMVDFDYHRFSQAFNKIIKRHGIMRMVVLESGEQKIYKNTPEYIILQSDLSGKNTVQIISGIKEIRNEMSHHVFDSSTWPLFEIRATYMTERLTRIHFSFDGLILDGSSTRILYNELYDLYKNPEKELMPLNLSFRDYVLAVEEHRESASYLEKKSYWQKRIPDFPLAPDLPVLQRTAAEGPIFKRYNYVLKKEYWDKLKQLCREKGITANTLLLAAYNEVLLTWSRNKHYVLNLTFFQRDQNIHHQVNDILGDFTSLILLEIDNTETKTLGERISSIHEQLWKDIDNSAYSGIRVIRDIAHKTKSKSTVRYPVVFTSLLSIDSTESELENQEYIEAIQEELQRLRFESEDESEELEMFEISQTPQVILDHQVSESYGELHIAWDVLEGIFPQGMIQEMFGAFCGLLDQFVLEPGLLDQKEPLKGMMQMIDMAAYSEDALGIGHLLQQIKDVKVIEGKEKRIAYIQNFIEKRLAGEVIPHRKQLPVCDDLSNEKVGTVTQSITCKDFFSLLNYFSAVQNLHDNKKKYRYASAGGLYPVDIYVAVNDGGVECIDKGMYFLQKDENTIYEISQDIWPETLGGSQFTLILVGSFDKIQSLYGEDSYGFMNIEAGIIAQGIKSEISQKGWQLSLLYGMNFEKLEKQLGLNSHQIILGVLGISNPAEKGRENEVCNVFTDTAPGDLWRRLNIIDYNRNQLPLILDPVQRYHFKQRQALRKDWEGKKKVLPETSNDIESINTPVASERRSYRSFTKNKISSADFKNLLETLTTQAEDNLMHLPYISYCNLHAVKLYFIVKENSIEGVNSGVYRFETIGAKWSMISKDYSVDQFGELYDNEVNLPIFNGAAFGIYFTVDLKECLPVYGDCAMEYAYFEVGAICHYLETQGLRFQIGFCQIGGLEHEYLLELFQADESELYLHSIFGGNISADLIHENINGTDPIYTDSINVMKKMIDTVTLLHTPFLERVKMNGDDIALVAGNKRITYKELDRMSDILAAELKQRGVVPNSLVAVLMAKGWEQIVSVLGILKAGGAYLPVDAELPRERIDYILATGDIKIVLTQKEYSRKEDCIVVHETLLAGNLRQTQIEDIAITGEDLAYVIFTSGSTGEPKGVMISHSGAINTITAINSLFHVTEHDKVAALSALDFDLSVYDIFGTFAAGGTLVIPNKNILKDPALLYNLIQQEKITIWNSVPAYLKMFLTYIKESQQSFCNDIRLVLLSGDWISVSMIGEISAMNQDIELISLGGATEASIWSIYYPVKEIDPQWRSIPYGKALPSQTVYVLDGQLNRVNILNPGEIWIGGAGLAKGYWKDPEKTRTHFAVHPQTGERLYRTGDIGQYLPDGNIEIMGRLDFQVKIQGFRIELNEIEINLRSHDDVQDAIIIPHGERDGEKILVAYVILRPGVSSSISGLKSYLASRLPHYMVPGMVFFMDAFPLTANGKIDRGAFPKPSLIAESTINYAKPSTTAQKKLLEIWKSKLSIEKVGINNNFFEMGGDSLMLLEIHREIQKQFDIEFPVIELFRFPTIESLTENLNLNCNTSDQKPDSGENRDSAKERAELRKNISRNRTKES